MSEQTKPQPILPRLDASHCELCKEAAEFIRQMCKAHSDELREADRAVRDAYSQGNFDGREESNGGNW